MKRKDFIRNTLLGFAAMMLPEVLRPIDVGVKKTQERQWVYHEFINYENDGNIYYYTGMPNWYELRKYVHGIKIT
jgi:hypothetical protein